MSELIQADGVHVSLLGATVFGGLGFLFVAGVFIVLLILDRLQTADRSLGRIEADIKSLRELVGKE